MAPCVVIGERAGEILWVAHKLLVVLLNVRAITSNCLGREDLNADRWPNDETAITLRDLEHLIRGAVAYGLDAFLEASRRQNY